jgi:phosphopantothenoylcysteine decarboxylase/phosphopantothenate--cysteine ligase
MKILITAGSTHEHIDPVRYITNASSGLQGICIANEAIVDNFVCQNNEVILILGPNTTKHLLKNSPKITVIEVTSADEMYEAAMKYFPSCDVAICSAAVGDYKVKNIATDKIKRNGDSIILELVPNHDIAKSLGAMKTDKQLLIGFALETSNGLENAKSKIIKKNLDFVVLNETSANNPAFGSDSNIVKFISKDGTIKEFDKMLKEDIAWEIIKLINI